MQPIPLEPITMQRTDLIIQNRDVSPVQRGNAPVTHAQGVSQQPATHKFHYTPDARRRKLSSNLRAQTTTTPQITAQQRTSARVNAYTEFQQRQTREFTPEEVQGYAQWILQADQLIESMRLKAERGKA